MNTHKSRCSLLRILPAAGALLLVLPAGAQQWDSPMLNFWEGLYAWTAVPSPLDWLILPVWGLYYRQELLAKASPDECFYGIAEEGEAPLPPQPLPCGEGGIPKVNEAYVWGLAKVGDNVWFGTAPNVHCLVLGGYLGMTRPHENDSWVCEFGRSWFANPPLDLPDSIGDWRPPRIYRYNTTARRLYDMSNLPSGPPGLHLQRLRATSGLRSAGALGDMVILGGPSLSQQGGINLFAFNGKTAQFLASRTLPQYNNIRKWVVIGGQLYTGVGYSPPKQGGAVLRWVANPASTNYPFEFEIVGEVDGAVAELAYHEGRIFVTTWPVRPAGGGLPPQAALWMSPKVPKGGLRAAHAAQWQRVWKADDYEPDPVTAVTYGGGALASFQGYLYWGTMHVPGLAMVAHQRVYGAAQNQQQMLDAFFGTHRPISIFRGKGFGNAAKPPVIELLYGLSEMPAYDGTQWVLRPNRMGKSPVFGLAGFNNFFNNYTWTMDVYDKRLFVGTMDFSYLVQAMLEGLELPSDPTRLSVTDPGADLIMFHSASKPGQAISKNGLGNLANYGIRTMLVSDGLYLGTANPMNLLPQGGWELRRITKVGK